MYNNIFVDAIADNIDKSWDAFLSKEVIDILNKNQYKILDSPNGYTPEKEKVLRFLEMPLNKIKVIILGQDPYPQKGVATGRAFEVATLNSWMDKFRNISLKNIVRLIYKTYSGETLKYSEILNKSIDDFKIASPKEIFESWEEQGVLLLNTSFTCRIGESNSHKEYWKDFTELLLNYIAKNNTEIKWFLWGNNAINIVKDVNIKHKYRTMHPMMCYNKEGRASDFLFGELNPFYETKDIINWRACK
ncbi:MAG: uracil-DNA glycosylase [Bacteroidales bacterium]|jgi:uracil-DNA glycosylase|nr:uracil-DNA glycosylase [Bacteroidales bacterium]